VIDAPFCVTTTVSRFPESVAFRLLGGAPFGPVPQYWIEEAISERRQRHWSRLVMRAPLFSKKGSGKFGMGVSAAKAGAAADAGQSAPVFSWSYTNGRGPFVAGCIGMAGGWFAGASPVLGGFVSEGFSATSPGACSPDPAATPAGSLVLLPDVAAAVPAAGPLAAAGAGAAGATVPAGTCEVEAASEQALPLKQHASAGREAQLRHARARSTEWFEFAMVSEHLATPAPPDCRRTVADFA
jgi:hypothetical protein